MTQYVILGEFDSQLEQNVNNIKEMVLKRFGVHQYLQDPPHCTFFLGSFHSFQEWSALLENKLHDIPDNYKKISIIGWKTFFQDKVTGKNTLYCQFDSTSIHHLRVIQGKIVDVIHPYLSSVIDRYNHCMNTFNDIERQNITRYGFPYVGDIWIPHITIASFSPDIYDEIFSEIRYDCPIGKGGLTKITICELSKEERLTFAKEIVLGESCIKN